MPTWSPYACSANAHNAEKVEEARVQIATMMRRPAPPGSVNRGPSTASVIVSSSSRQMRNCSSNGNMISGGIENEIDGIVKHPVRGGETPAADRDRDKNEPWPLTVRA